MRKPPAYLLAVSLALAASSQAQHHDHDEHPFIMPGTPAKTIPAPTPWFTGAQLLQSLDPPVSAPDRQALIAGAEKYLTGVYDATESGVWCHTDGRPRPIPKQPPEVMRKAAINYLRKLPVKRRQEKAATLLVDMWQEKWPCPPAGCCPGRGY